VPTYDYECTHCRHKFEISQKITDRSLDKCPKCNQKLKRLIGSGSGIIFKGKGFYATDYRKDKPAPVDKSQNNTCPNLKKGCKDCQSQ